MKILEIPASNLQVANRCLQFSSTSSFSIIYLCIVTHNYIDQEMIKRNQENVQQQTSLINKSKIARFLFQKQYQIVETPRQFFLFFLALALLFLILTVISFVLIWPVKQIQLPYATDGACVNSGLATDRCSITFNIQEDIDQKIYLLYDIKNIYMNHRKFFASQSVDQLKGKVIESNQAYHQCQPFILNKDISQKQSWSGSPLNQSEVSSPCGFKAQGFFNDSFKIYKDGSLIQIGRSGLYKGNAVNYHRAPNSQQHQWVDVESDDFKLYMLDASLQTRKRPWGILENGLKAGRYELLAQNYYNLPDQKMKKGIILTTVSIMGGKQYFFCASFGTITFLCFLVILLAKNHLKGNHSVQKTISN